MPYTMAHHFKKAGYDTAALGKMHFIPDTETSRGNERNWGFDVRTDYEEYWHYLVDEQGCVPSQELDKAPRDIAHLEMQQHVLQTQLVKPDASVQPNAKVAEHGTLPHEAHQEAFILRDWEKYLQNKAQQYKTSTEDTAPFFAFVSMQSSHWPFVSPRNFMICIPI